MGKVAACPFFGENMPYKAITQQKKLGVTHQKSDFCWGTAIHLAPLNLGGKPAPGRLRPPKGEIGRLPIFWGDYAL